MKILMDELAMARSLKSITHEIIEKNKGTNNLVLVGLYTRGIDLANRVSENLKQIENVIIPTVGLDVSYWRDDELKKVAKPEIKEDFKGKIVIIIDDVLFKGRTVRAAMEGIIAHGRPAQIQLAVLIDRGHRELPLRADYVGKNIPTSIRERVYVQTKETDGVDQVVLQGGRVNV